jgi:glutaredoxin
MSKNVILLLLLCVLGGLIHNQNRMARWWHRPPAVAQKPGETRVVLYATTWCGYCAKAREFFAEQRIPYRELDVERSDEGRAGYASLGGGGIPIIVVDGRTVIRGYGPDAILDALR